MFYVDEYGFGALTALTLGLIFNVFKLVHVFRAWNVMDYAFFIDLNCVCGSPLFQIEYCELPSYTCAIDQEIVVFYENK